MSKEDLGPGTWDYELRKHFEAFTKVAWVAFNNASERMRKEGHENKVSKIKWREYVIWDMQRRHEKELTGEDR